MSGVCLNLVEQHKQQVNTVAPHFGQTSLNKSVNESEQLFLLNRLRRIKSKKRIRISTSSQSLQDS